MNELFELVLARLGFSGRPEPTLDNLRAVYSAWCQRVPFDNVRKLIHVRSRASGPLPGSSAEDFFEAWLRHGTGGTCWSGAGAFHALLTSLGFNADRGVGTMLVAPDVPPNHGTVLATFGAEKYLVDCAILHGEPLRLEENGETRIEHPAWGVRCSQRSGFWQVWWRALHKPDGLECRYEWFGAESGEFRDFYERTRAWSPFNYELTARVNRGDEVIGVSFGKAVTLRGNGQVAQAPIPHEERMRLLVEQFGMSEEIVSQIPEDVPTPPPPGTRARAEAEL